MGNLAQEVVNIEFLGVLRIASIITVSEFLGVLRIASFIAVSVIF